MTWILLACANAADSGPGLDTATLAGGSEPRVPEAELSAEEAAAAIEAAMALGLPTPLAPIDTLTALLLAGDDMCPGPARESGGMEVIDVRGCVSGEGYWYQGVGAAWAQWAEEPNTGYARTFELVFSADGTIAEPPGGEMFEFGGTIEVDFDYDAEGNASITGSVQGTYDFPAAEEPWLAAGASLGSYWTGTVSDPGDYAIQLDGGFTLGGTTIDMASLSIGGPCGEALSGTIAYRDTRGYWYDLALDESTCDGCGNVVFAATSELGRACVNVAERFATPFEAVLARIEATP